ncbi:MAG: hypothetical protein EOP48_13835 [Sphingobacteriales bacterium]|nr:MAG: hypothetical protein EOP48_13835 [Sphingobacteriales bacterium]
MLFLYFWYLCLFLIGFVMGHLFDDNFSSLCDPLTQGPRSRRSRGNRSVDLYHGIEIDSGSIGRMSEYYIADYRRKLMMGWSQKAGCSASVQLLLDGLGVTQAVNYTGIGIEIHLLRAKYVERCGRVLPSIVKGDDWYRFKIVRNPFDRVVSQYMSTVKVGSRTRGMNLTHGNDTSFEDYINALTLLGNGIWHVDRNSFPQYLPLEMELHRKSLPGFFHRVIKVEELAVSLPDLSRETNLTFFFRNFTSEHYAKRVASHNPTYVGNLSWSILKQEVPESYASFYTKELRDKVAQLFAIDILLYNYSYPYQNL